MVLVWTGKKSWHMELLESHKEMRVIRSLVEWNEHENQKTIETTEERDQVIQNITVKLRLDRKVF
jgi:hypothetical protein